MIVGYLPDFLAVLELYLTFRVGEKKKKSKTFVRSAALVITNMVVWSFHSS